MGGTPSPFPWPTLIRHWGFVVFAVSFVTPTCAFNGCGIVAFLLTAQFIWTEITHYADPRTWQELVFLTSMCLGWLSNFTVFFSLRRVLAAAATIAPWTLYFSMIFFENSRSINVQFIKFIPFYPWAIGIAMIHLPGLIERRATDSSAQAGKQP